MGGITSLKKGKRGLRLRNLEYYRLPSRLFGHFDFYWHCLCHHDSRLGDISKFGWGHPDNSLEVPVKGCLRNIPTTYAQITHLNTRISRLQ